ncbi:MAG: class I SAM-dependent methyltransferase [Myxococcota bacterium]
MTSTRRPTEKELAYDRLGERFDTGLSSYDTARRVEVLVDQFLGPARLRGRKTIDVGCGLGYFSERAFAHGADVLATDIGPTLVERTTARVGCKGQVADALRLEETFGAGAFDVVVSSECVEHTPDPEEAIRQLCRLVAPGGYLSMSTPNVLWYPVVRLATILRLRPFDGHENFSTWGKLRRIVRSEGLVVESEIGLHLFPFQFRAHGLSRFLDTHAQGLRSAMINLCILAHRPA